MRLKRIKEFSPETTKLTEFCRSTSVDEQSIMECDNIREFKTATTTAYNVKLEEREDGHAVKVSSDSIAQTVTVSLIPKPEQS